MDLIKYYLFYKKYKSHPVYIFFAVTILISHLLSLQNLFGQKLKLDSRYYKSWPRISEHSASLSNDGQYASYTVNNLQTIIGRYLIIQKINSKWKLEIKTSNNFLVPCEFTNDSKYVVYVNNNDSLQILNLKTKQVKKLPDVSSFKISSFSTRSWAAFKLKKSVNSLTLCSLPNAKIKLKLDNVTDYFFSNKADYLILKISIDKEIHLKCINLLNFRTVNFFKGPNAEIIPNCSNDKIVFSVLDKDGLTTIHSYLFGGKESTVLFPDLNKRIDSVLKFKNFIGYSQDGTKLYINLEKRSATKNPEYANVKIMSSNTDGSVINGFHSRQFKAVIHLNNNKIIQLENENEELYNFSIAKQAPNDYCLLVKRSGVHPAEAFWNDSALSDLSLVSVNTGDRKLIRRQFDILRSHANYVLAPDEKCIVYFDEKQQRYRSIEIATWLNRVISENGNKDFLTEYISYRPTLIGVAGWVEDHNVLIYSRNDIWLMNTLGQRKAVNITNGYGKQNNIIFRIAMDYQKEKLKIGDKIILCAFDKKNKENGFYEIQLGASNKPKKLTSGPVMYYMPIFSSNIPGAESFTPIKAKNRNVFLVKRMSSTESPNYFSTIDFKSFNSLSDLHPEQEFNWLKSELHSYKLSDSIIAQGILYKPQDFDPQKKYPIIFVHYEKMSDRLNTYLYPELENGLLDIPWYISNGYLIFTPDIHFKQGEFQESAFQSINSAVKYITKLPYVDSVKMGIQGMSLSGITTNFILSRTTAFAAACSMAGWGDYISAYLTGSDIVETNMIGASLWERPDLYIKNSVVFQIDKISTPLLLVHTQEDGVAPYANIMELFTGLRRLKKTAWMLTYDGKQDNHGVGGESSFDYHTRMAQFFNFYLKNENTPYWMNIKP